MGGLQRCGVCRGVDACSLVDCVMSSWPEDASSPARAKEAWDRVGSGQVERVEKEGLG